MSDDSDGPIKCCRPVPRDQAETLAADIAELGLRIEPAHRDAFVNLGPGGQISPAQWQLASESLDAWATGQGARPTELGVRVTFLTSSPVVVGSHPDCDFAAPIS